MQITPILYFLSMCSYHYYPLLLLLILLCFVGYGCLHSLEKAPFYTTEMKYNRRTKMKVTTRNESALKMYTVLMESHAIVVVIGRIIKRLPKRLLSV